MKSVVTPSPVCSREVSTSHKPLSHGTFVGSLSREKQLLNPEMWPFPCRAEARSHGNMKEVCSGAAHAVTALRIKSSVFRTFSTAHLSITVFTVIEKKIHLTSSL